MKIKFLSSVLLLLIISISSFAEKFGGIEVGGKGLKISVIDIKNLETGEFTIIKSWSRNTAITRGISIDGRLRPDDITESANAVKEILDQLKSEYSLADDHIFTIASSGVGMATNRQDFVNKVKELTGREITFVTSEQEGKLVTKGAVPPSKYMNSVTCDIGGGNTKGGYVSLDDANHYVFTPMAFELGSVTLTEKLKKNAKSPDFKDFAASAIEYNDTLRSIIKYVNDNKPAIRRKANVYMIGGTVWSFMTLTRPGSTNAFENFTLQDIKNYQYDIVNNWEKFEALIDNNKDVAKVFDTYSREALLAGSYIMIDYINDMQNPDQKKLVFVRNGYIAWIVAYVVDKQRGNIK